MKQALLQDYRDLRCHYCGGRGFYVLERTENGKEVPENVVIECKFCGGTGARNQSLWPDPGS